MGKDELNKVINSVEIQTQAKKNALEVRTQFAECFSENTTNQLKEEISLNEKVLNILREIGERP